MDNGSQNGGVIKKGVAILATATVTFLVDKWFPLLLPKLLQATVGVFVWLGSKHGVYGWLIVLSSFCTIAFLAIAAHRLTRHSTRNTWMSYRQDDFFGMKWRWNYRGHEIGDPAPFCRDCDTQIVPVEKLGFGRAHEVELTSYDCDHCRTTSLELPGTFRCTQDRVVRQIDRIMRSKEEREQMDQ